jgi:hypothetical protein
MKCCVVKSLTWVILYISYDFSYFQFMTCNITVKAQYNAGDRRRNGCVVTKFTHGCHSAS